jgi:serine/threonine protein kinase
MGHHRIGANRYVKIYYFNIPGVFTLRTFYNEVYLQSKASMLHHPDFSVPKIYDYGQVTPILNDPERPGWVMVYFIMEYINGYCLIPSDLERVEPHLTGCRRVKRNVLSHRISSIDEWLQTNGIYHNDLNFGNILKVRDGKYYIIDFGESSEYPKTFAHMRNTSRTRRHRIPYTPH